MKKNRNKLSITIAKNSFKDDGDGLITFTNGLTITDDSVQHNGTKYDIKSMDISGYSGILTANHDDTIQSVVGKALNTRKVANRRIVVDGIQFAINENALARYAYDMLNAGFLTDFSIETVGPWPTEDGLYENSSLVGLSIVTVGNNKSANVNDVVVNSIAKAKENGLDTSIVEQNFLCYDTAESINHSKNNEEIDNMKFITIKNSRGFAVTVAYKNAAEEELKVVLEPGASVDVSEDQKEVVEKQITEASEPKAEADESLQTILKAINDVTSKMSALEQKVFDNAVKAPKFTKSGASSELSTMDWRARHGLQISKAWDFLKSGNASAGQELNDINKFNFEELQKAGVVTNAMTIADMGNFVVSPELLTEIEGHRSNFAGLISKLDYKDTLSTQMAWLKRSGDISMTEVEMCDDGADGNLKPISEYGAEIKTSNLHELAAVTPVCNAATRFLAAELLGDVAQGYRNDYDRKRAQLFIAKLQGAVDTTGEKTAYNGTSAVTKLTSWVDVWSRLGEKVPNGVFIYSYKTQGELIRQAITAGISGPLATTLMSGDLSSILGRSSIVVPDELLPTLNSAETKSFTVEGVAVTINQAVFYVDLSTFTGRTSGGLQYDLSTEAAYEDGASVKSAFQRNELVLRGSFFRGGAIKDDEKVASLFAAGVS